jgi:hypothetical protein
MSKPNSTPGSNSGKVRRRDHRRRRHARRKLLPRMNRNRISSKDALILQEESASSHKGTGIFLLENWQ